MEINEGVQSVDERVYFIYKYTFPNGKIYIGQTYKGSRRFGRVSSYKNMLVRRAMDKYPNFEKEIVEYCSFESVDEREQFYIEYYSSMNKELGYNLTSGGQTNKHLSAEVRKVISEKRKGAKMAQDVKERISKPVIQIEPSTLNAINRFYSIMDAASNTGVDYSTISSVCNRKSSTAGGFFWCFEEDYDDSYVPREIGYRGHIYTDEERLERSIMYSGVNNPMYGTHRRGSDNPHSIPVYQYSLKGKFIAKYDCVRTACHILHLESNYSAICSCARGKLKQASNFIWRYDGSENDIEEYVRHTTKGYRHTEAAKDKMRVARIGKTGGARARAVLKYDLEGNFIEEYVSSNNADDMNGLSHGNVYAACSGKKKSVGGFMWRFKTVNFPIKIDPYVNSNKKAVIQMDRNDNFIKKWSSAQEAAEQLGISSSGITACCRGYKKYVTAGGYKWKYD